MTELHVVSAPREKRSAVAGRICDLRREIDRLQADLFHIDAVLRLYGEEPGDIPTKGRMPHFSPDQVSMIASADGQFRPGSRSATRADAPPEHRTSLITTTFRLHLGRTWQIVVAATALPLRNSAATVGPSVAIALPI